LYSKAGKSARDYHVGQEIESSLKIEKEREPCQISGTNGDLSFFSNLSQILINLTNLLLLFSSLPSLQTHYFQITREKDEPLSNPH